MIKLQQNSLKIIFFYKKIKKSIILYITEKNKKTKYHSLKPKELILIWKKNKPKNIKTIINRIEEHGKKINDSSQKYFKININTTVVNVKELQEVICEIERTLKKEHNYVCTLNLNIV